MMIFIPEITSWVIKSTILQKVNSGLALCKLELTNRENIISCIKIKIGCSATKVINNEIRTDTATPKETDISVNPFKSLCYSLSNVKILSTKYSDTDFKEYKNFMQNVVFVSTEFKSYDITESRLDKSFLEITSLKKYPILEKIMKMMLCFNHCQAHIER